MDCHESLWSLRVDAVVDNGTRDLEAQGRDFSSPLMSSQNHDLPNVPGRGKDPASFSTPTSISSSTPCSPTQPTKVRTDGCISLSLTLGPKASKFKPPRSFTSTKRDQVSNSAVVLPSKRLSSDLETPPSSAIQPKRPKCYTGCEKENQFSQEIPLGGVTNLVRTQTPVSPRKKAVECIDVDHGPPSSSNHSFDATLGLSGVS